jgi:hypothetical protein
MLTHDEVNTAVKCQFRARSTIHAACSSTPLFLGLGLQDKHFALSVWRSLRAVVLHTS